MASLQDVIRCHLCETPLPSKHCDICHVHLCEACVEDHLSEESTEHKVVPFALRGSIPKCSTHFTKICEQHCEECNIPICAICALSGKHDQHNVTDILKIMANKKELMQKDLHELEKSLFPMYEDALSNITVQKSDLSRESQKLTTAICTQGEVWHREIDSVIQNLQAEIDGMESQFKTSIDKQEKEIKDTFDKIAKITRDIRILIDSRDVCLVSKYKSSNEEFRKLPLTIKVSLPNFQPGKVNIENVLKQFGSFETVKEDYDIQPPGFRSTPEHQSLLDMPRIITHIATGFTELYNLSCLSDEKIWTLGKDKIMKLYNLQGELIKSVETKSGNVAFDMALTGGEDLVYTDYNDRSINLVSDTHIQTLITLRGWKPLGVCSTYSGDLLVIMTGDDMGQTKVVRYFGTTEKQSIQLDNEGKPLYSSGYITKYIKENSNFDIIVSDWGAGAVVVVSAAGKYRFRYTGHAIHSKELFYPAGIATDSHARILIADFITHRIHILEKDGHFLRYIDNCGLREPCGLYVDFQDILFVAEWRTGKVKKIQYYQLTYRTLYEREASTNLSAE